MAHMPSTSSQKIMALRWTRSVTAAEVAAAAAPFNLIEPINQALLPGLAYEPEGVVAKVRAPRAR